MIYIAKIFAVILGATVVSKSYLDFKKKQESLVMFLFWIVTWVGIVYIAIFPITIDKIINLLGGQKTGLGTVFGMGLVFLFFVIYRVYHKAHKIEKQIKELVTKIGLENLPNK